MATTLSIRIDDDLETRLERYREQFKFQPPKSDIGRRALEEFLDRELEEIDS